MMVDLRRFLKVFVIGHVSEGFGMATQNKFCPKEVLSLSEAPEAKGKL